MMVSGFEIAAAARLWLRTPFVHQGRLRGVGVDCAGLVIGVSRDLGIVALDFEVTGYSRTPDGVSLKGYCDAHMLQIREAEMRLGDAVLVAWGSGAPQHLGFLDHYRHGGFSMIHAENRRHHEVIETRLLFGNAMRFVAAYRLPERVG